MSSLNPIMAATSFAASHWHVTLGGAGLVFALSSDQNQARTIIVVQRGYGLTTASARGIFRLANDLAHTDTGMWIITNLSRGVVQTGARALQGFQEAMTSTRLAWAHFTMLSGYVRLVVFGDGYPALLADEQVRLQSLIIRQIEEQRQPDEGVQAVEDISSSKAEDKIEDTWVSQGDDAGEQPTLEILGIRKQEHGGGENEESSVNLATKRSREEMEDSGTDVDEFNRLHKKTKAAHTTHNPPHHARDGRQFCVGTKANGEPCARTRRPAEGLYFCCRAHELQYSASGLLATPI
jgi:hypothetical protein